MRSSALIGASGSGKSTLLRCINRLVNFDHGEIRLDGVSIEDPRFGATGLQKRIGIVFQSYNLFPTMTVLNNITLCAATGARHQACRSRGPGRAIFCRCSGWRIMRAAIRSN